MNALFDAYYYGIENGEVQGPCPLNAITARVKSGDVPEWVMLSRTATGPWAPVRLVEQLGDEAFAPPKPKPAQKLADPRPARLPATPKPVAATVRQTGEKKQHGTVAGFYEVIGVLFIVMGAAGLGGGITLAIKGNLLGWTMLGSAIVCFITALGLMATSEVLRRLLAIAESVRTMAEKE